MNMNAKANDLEGAYMRGIQAGYDEGYRNGFALSQDISEEFHKQACDSWYEKGKIDGVSEYLQQIEKTRATAPVINDAPAKKRGRPRKVAHESC